jgi:hypothetical protein
MSDCAPILFLLDLKPNIKTNKNKYNPKQLKLDIYKSNRILSNLYNDSVEVYYNTCDEDELDMLSNLFTNDRPVHIFYRKYITESYTYLGDMSELSIIDYNNVDEYKYFNILIDKSYNHKIPILTSNKKNDIIKYLGYNLTQDELSIFYNETIFDLNDIFYRK